MKMRKRESVKASTQAQLSTEPRRILVPVDFSDPSRRALGFARGWAQRFGAKVYLLHVVEPLTFLAGVPDVPIAISPREVARSASRELGQLAKTEFPKDVRVAVLVRRGRAYDQIVTAAKSLAIDLIVIATHGHTGFDRMLLGSTAERVVRYAPCPVLTIRRRSR